MNHKQKERQQRGEDWQDAVRRSWRLVPNTWRLRIPDGGGGTRPADELVLTEEINILAEHKCTNSDRFQLAYLTPGELKGLMDFDLVISRNLGLVFIHFLNEEKGIDEAYAFRITAAIMFMYDRKREYITLEEFRSGVPLCIPLPRLEAPEPTYDLKGVLTCYS